MAHFLVVAGFPACLPGQRAGWKACYYRIVSCWRACISGSPIMRIDILTIFPGMFAGGGPLGASIIGRAVERGIVDLRVHDLRDWTTDRHRSIDDYPYGGGAGMVMKAPHVVEAI